MAVGEMSEAEYTAFLLEVFQQLAEHSTDGSLHYQAIDWRHLPEMIAAGRRAYAEMINLCVWVKNAPGMGSFYRSQHELFCVFKSAAARPLNNVKLGKFGRARSNVWSYPGANTFSRTSDEGNLLHTHPTVKNLSLVVDILLDASTRGDLVLDPFMGSGTTLIAAEKVGRRARGIEIDPLYVDAAVRRWERWTGEQAILEGDGRTFAEVAAAQAEEAGDGE
jgi:DNA modification methylase